MTARSQGNPFLYTLKFEEKKRKKKKTEKFSFVKMGVSDGNRNGRIHRTVLAVGKQQNKRHAVVARGSARPLAFAGQILD